ncbi:hypothetical protein HOB94_04085 [bacterium]|nr:hypothetical protein [bacterium]MBT4633134.1 hypothetical protein [bacterium]MBT6778925.1 hypothetical protein [bacterium]
MYSVATFTSSSIFSSFAVFSSLDNQSVIYSSYLIELIISLISSETTFFHENFTKLCKMQ